jgi:hypothetical protein
MARFAVSIWDSLFGPTMETALHAADGRVYRRRVTKKWFWRMVGLGQITEGPVNDEARLLLAKARLTAVNTLSELVDDHDLLVDIDDDLWVYYVVVGIIAAGTMLSAKRFPDFEHIARTAVMDAEAEKWHEGAGKAIHDCATLVVGSVSRVRDAPMGQKSDVIGDLFAEWALTELLGRPTTQEEGAIVRPLGIAMTADAANWWTTS